LSIQHAIDAAHGGLLHAMEDYVPFPFLVLLRLMIRLGGYLAPFGFVLSWLSVLRLVKWCVVVGLYGWLVAVDLTGMSRAIHYAEIEQDMFHSSASLTHFEIFFVEFHLHAD
jgi:hypothetical protein